MQLSRAIHLSLFALFGLVACTQPDARDVGVEIEALRPDTPGTSLQPPVFGASDKVELLDSKGGSFRVHYTRNGVHAVPAADANSDGIPDFVQQVADEYDAVGDFYADELGFDPPISDGEVRDDNGGDARFDVYLLDFATSADGSFRSETCQASAAYRCTGYMLHENDFAGRNYSSLARANRILASHEYFHAIQNAYNAQAGVVLSEGTAVWASEQYDPTLTDLEGFVPGYLGRTDRSLTQEPGGPVDAFAYGSSLFFQFLTERYDGSVIRELWTSLREEGAAARPGSWAPALDAILRDAHQSSLAGAFTEFTRWNLYTGPRADAGEAYASGEGYSEVKFEPAILPFEDESVRVFPLAARFYSGRVREGGTVRFTATAATALSGLRLILARELRGKILEVRTSEGDATSLTIDVESGETLDAVVLNTRLSGESLRPDLCLGTSGCGEDEEPAEESDAGPDDEEDDEPPPKSDDSGCSASGARTGGFDSFALGLAFAALVTLRSRRRPRQAASR